SGTTGANAVGGAILYGDPGGSLSVTGSTLNANVVQASTTGNGASASGGGIQGSFDSATIRGDTFSGNRLTASSPSAAAVVGGGLSTQAATKLSFASSKVTGSVLKSVSTGAEATGEGAGIWNLGPLSIVSSVISGGTINAQGAT